MGHLSHVLLQSVAVLSLSGKAYIERPRDSCDHADGCANAKVCDSKKGGRKLRRQKKRVQKVVDQFRATRRLLGTALRLGIQLTADFDKWLAVRNNTIEFLEKVGEKVQRWEKRILITDCTSGSFGAVGGCLTLASLILGPAGLGAAAALSAVGLGLESVGAASALVMLLMKLGGTGKATRNAKRILEEDRRQTYKLAALCQEIVALNQHLTASSRKTLALIEELGVDVGKTYFTQWPGERTMEILCVTGEVLGSIPAVTQEIAHRWPWLLAWRGTKVSTVGAHTAAGLTAAVAPTAARVAKQGLLERTPEVALHAVPAGSKGVACHATRTLTTNSLPGTAYEGAAALTMQGSKKSGAKLLNSTVRVQELFCGALTGCGIFLELLNTSRAFKRIREGSHSELGAVIDEVVGSLKKNRDNFTQFKADNAWLSNLSQFCQTHFPCRHPSSSSVGRKTALSELSTEGAALIPATESAEGHMGYVDADPQKNGSGSLYRQRFWRTFESRCHSHASSIVSTAAPLTTCPTLSCCLSCRNRDSRDDLWHGM